MPTKTRNEQVLGLFSEIPAGEGRVFAVDGREIAVFNIRGSGIRAVQAQCPHKDGPLADGLLGGTTVMCPFHSRKFDLTTGAEIGGECKLEVYDVAVNDQGEIVLRS